MRNKHIFVLSMLVLLTCALKVSFSSYKVNAFNPSPVHNLNTGLNYTTIQEAVDADETLNGHTIFVDSGLYSEHVMITKSLSIVGEDASTTIIDGGNLTSVMELQADNITVTNFTIRNCGPQSAGRAFSLENVENCRIIGNNIKNNYYAITLFSSSNVTMFGNNLTDNNVGVLLISASVNRIVENNVENNLFGNELVSSSNNTIMGNDFAGNSHGVALYQSSNSNRIYENNIRNNGFGIEIDTSMNNKIYHNDFFNNSPQVFIYESDLAYPNVWDDGYPSGGNFWSDFVTKHPNASEIDASGIWNIPYVFNANNTDRYPLMAQHVITEFPSSLVLPLFMIVTALAFIVMKAKRRRLSELTR